jgi:hypothetical protein
LQYANDAPLFSSGDNASLRNLKTILVLFEKVSCMKINFYKSEFISMNIDVERVHDIAHILTCPIDKFPFKYLGVPLHFYKLRREDL